MTMSSKNCYFCKKEPEKSRELYFCPQCNVPYCSLACYKHTDHASCSESFYRQWIEEECLSDPDKLFDHSRAAGSGEHEETDDGVEGTAFAKKEKDRTDAIFNFSTNNAEKVDENDVNLQLQQLGITDPNDVEELLDALTDKEKEHFLNLVGEGYLDKALNEER